MTIQELKAFAYDLLAQQQALQRTLNETNQEIARLILEQKGKDCEPGLREEPTKQKVED